MWIRAEEPYLLPLFAVQSKGIMSFVLRKHVRARCQCISLGSSPPLGNMCPTFRDCLRGYPLNLWTPPSPCEFPPIYSYASCGIPLRLGGYLRARG